MAEQEAMTRRLPIGAEVLADDTVDVRVWAPDRTRVAVEVEVGGEAVELFREPDGYFAGRLADARAGTRYRFRLDDDPTLYPDPASRFQPDGPHGPSEIVDPTFAWTDKDWAGIAPEGQVLYEIHIGTFTQEGSWTAATARLPALAELGVTVLEIMPITEFAGRFGWGYDGVDLFAPTRLYGRPEDVRRFVDRAHACGLGVILDVVYNHLGPDGNYLAQFARAYFTDRYANEWGDAIDFDGPASAGVREFFVANAGYWIDEFHFDGLRLDATQQIFDRSGRHVLAEIASRVRAAGRGRATYLVAENEPQEIRTVLPRALGGYGLDAMWNDDFHHSAMVALTDRREAYYSDHLGQPQEFISAAKYGFLYQGQRYSWQGQPRGTPALGLSPHQFVAFLQNHDQIANSARGTRLHELTSPGRLRALTALLLLGPQTPMLFQGQEIAATAPFRYFADHKPDLADAVRQGRRQFLGQFETIASIGEQLPDPDDPATFQSCKLDWENGDAAIAALHRDLLRLRRTDPVFARPRPGGVDGAVLGPEAFLLRFFGSGDRLLLVNLGRDLVLEPAPEPLLGPPPDHAWHLLWSSEDPAYGGLGTPPLDPDKAWRLQGNAATLLTAVPRHW